MSDSIFILDDRLAGLYKDSLVASQDAPGRDKVISEGQDTSGSIFTDFKPMTWAEYSKALDDHERAAYWQGYKAAKDEILQAIVNRPSKWKGPDCSDPIG